MHLHSIARGAVEVLGRDCNLKTPHAYASVLKRSWVVKGVSVRHVESIVSPESVIKSTLQTRAAVTGCVERLR